MSFGLRAEPLTETPEKGVTEAMCNGRRGLFVASLYLRAQQIGVHSLGVSIRLDDRSKRPFEIV